MTERMILDRMDQMIRLGFVNARMPEKMRVKVTLRDTPGGALVTDWLPVLCPRASGDMQYDLPDVGDQVLCLFLPYGLEQGFVVGGMYGKQVPPARNADKWHRTFRDGTSLEYDRAEHKLTADIRGGAGLAATGSVTMKAQGPITLEAPIIYVRGTLVNTATDGGPGKSVFSGGMEVLDGGISVPGGDVVAAGVSLTSHTTDGVMPGGGTSSHPTGGSAESPGTAAKPLPEPGTAAYAAAVAAGLVEARELVSQMPYTYSREIDSLILCLPEIADAMSARKNGEGKLADAQGWEYLAGFFRKWLSTKVVLPESGDYNEENYGPQPLFISWEWLDKYPRIGEKIAELVESMKKKDFGIAFAENLKKRKEKYFTGETTVFDFIPSDINDTSLWRRWYDNHQKFIKVPGNYFAMIRYGVDGLIASMGGFALYALPRGTVQPMPGGGHKILITDLAVFARDGFNFEGAEALGFWNCEGKVFSPADPEVGRLLGNHSFRQFRKDTSYGGNFYIFAVPRMVDLPGVIEHDVSL